MLALLAIRESDLLLRLFLPLRASASRTLYKKEQWEQEYASGEWGFLTSPDEAGHYHLISSYYNALKPDSAVLDVGCGEGILRTVLAPHGYRYYQGLDISEKAIEKASVASDERTVFTATDVNAFHTEKKFDVIIFNETLYYFASPLETLQKYQQFLAPGGIFIISMALCWFRDGLLKLKIWRDIEGEFPALHESCIFTRNGPTWIVRPMRASKD